MSADPSTEDPARAASCDASHADSCGPSSGTSNSTSSVDSLAAADAANQGDPFLPCLLRHALSGDGDVGDALGADREADQKADQKAVQDASPLETEAASGAGSHPDSHPDSHHSLGNRAFDVDQFTAPAVRDLAWLMLSPSLLSPRVFGASLADPFAAECFGADARARLIERLHALDADPLVLTDALRAGREQRLGRYAERLLAAWLSNAPGIEIEALGLPVRDGGLTLGECDALFRTAAGCREHWELAVKFYLFVDDPLTDPPTDPLTHGDPAGVRTPSVSAPRAGVRDALPDDPHVDRLDGCDAYVGAGLADRFDWKLRRLIDHQLPLSAHPGLVALAPGPWQPRMYVKGRLFYPLARWCDARNDAAALTPDHPRGWWATLDRWLAFSARSASRWIVLDRLDWLAPLRVDAASTFDREAFVERLVPRLVEGQATQAGEPTADTQRVGAALRYLRPVQVAALQPDGTGGQFREVSRGFIVPNDWPERAVRFRFDQGGRGR